MKLDIPGPHPRKVVLYRDNRELVYDLPFDAVDPVDIEALLSVPGIEVIPEPVRPEPAPELEDQPKRPSRKEVLQ